MTMILRRWKRIACGLMVMGSAMGTAYAGLFDNWAFRMKLSFPGYTQSETLTNFPVLIVFSNNVGGSGFSYDGFSSETGADLRFASSNETMELNYEIEQWNTNGGSYVWVQMPALASSNDFIYAYWGKSDATAPVYTTNGAVWSSEFRGVWHMGHLSGTDVRDATINRRHGVTYNMPPNPWTNGAVGGALAFDGVNDYVFGMGNGVVPAGGNPYTVSVWFKRTANSGMREMISQWAQGNNDFFLGFNGDNVRFSDNWNSVNVGLVFDANWYHLVAVSTPNNAYLYLNGTLKATRGSPLTYTRIDNLWFGRQGTYNNGAEWFSGLMDEVRIESVSRSSNWIWASWMNQASPSAFLGYAMEPIGPPAIENRPATNLTITSAFLNGFLVSTGLASTTVAVYWGDTDGGTPTSGLWKATNIWAEGAWTDGSYPSYWATGLVPNAFYYYRFAASNEYGMSWASYSSSFLAGEVGVSGGSAYEAGPIPGTFTVWRAASATGAATVVNFTIGGTATLGMDYFLSATNTVTIPAGASNAAVVVMPLVDPAREPIKTVTLTILPGAYALGAASYATVTITDEERAQWKMTLQATGYDKPEPLTNFPALVILSTNIANFRYSDFLSGTNADLRFYDSAQTNELPYEIELWDTNGSSYVWVRVPALTPSTKIHAFWGQSGLAAPAYTTNGEVWSSEFRGVWHMGHLSGTDVRDATANRRHGVTYNMPPNPWTNGAVGGALAFDGVNDYVFGMGNGVVPPGGYPYTVSVWFKRTANNGLREMISQWINTYSGQSFYLGFNGDNVRFSDSWNSVNVGLVFDANWYHLAAVSTPNNAYLYVNGVLKATKGSALTYTGIHDLWFGRQGYLNGEYFSGLMDEVRIESVSRSSNWIWASWMNQASNSMFWTYGPVEAVAKGTLIMIR